MLVVLDNIKAPEQFTASSPAKISLKSNRAFSLPAGPVFSCPGATDACVGCYAMKNRHLFSNVQAAFAKNWLLIKKLGAKKDTSKAVQALLDIIPKDAKIFRIHESGDFYSQWYVDVWAKVVKQRPDVQFWAYTRSFQFNFNELTKQKNFALWASTDKYNEKEAKKFVRKHRKSGVKHAIGPWKHNEEIPDKSFICPVTSKKLKVDGACEKCRLCVVKKLVSKNVVFLEH